MSDLKISQLSDGGASQAADEYVVARSGSNYRIDGASVAAAATSVGTLAGLTMTGNLTLDTDVVMSRGAANRLDLASGDSLNVVSGTYKIAGTDVLSSSTLGSGVTASSLTSVGTLTSLTVSGDLTVDTSTLKVDSTNNRVGIGTASPGAGYRLHIVDSGNTVGTNTPLFLSSANGVATTSYGWDNLTSSYDYTIKVNGSTTALTISNTGNLGLGVTPSAVGNYGVVQVRGRSTSQGGMVVLETSDGSSGKSEIYQSSTALGINVISNLPLTFGTNNSERARITSGGYFKASDNGAYVSTETSTQHSFDNSVNTRTLAVKNGNASFTGGVLEVFADRNTTNGTYNFIGCTIVGVAEKFYVQDSGNVYNTNGTYGTISDERLKQDIVDAGSAWNDLKAVRFRKYRMRSDVEANPDAPAMLGVIAQELEHVMPGLVQESPTFEETEVTDEDGNVTTERVQVGTTKTVKSSILLMKAAVALQEAMARIEALEARLEALEA